MRFPCQFKCGKTFTNKSNRSRHEIKFHPDELGLPVFHCSLCDIKTRKLEQLITHMRETHEKYTNHCITCRLGFNDAHLYAQHMRSVHTLPVFGPDFDTREQPSKSAFGGVLQNYLLSPNNDESLMDIRQFMSIKRAHVEELVNERLASGPQKMQMSIELRLMKPTRESTNPNDDDDDERVVIFCNSWMTQILPEGLTDEVYDKMIEKMLAVFFTFASSGSGWVLDEIIHLHVHFARNRPIRGSSFIYLPYPLSELSFTQSLINIRNHNDHDCFIYCYMAAYCLHHHISFESPICVDRAVSVYPETYLALDNSIRPKGDFEMPMGLRDIPRFETTNDVQVNVFGFEKRHIFPIRVSKKDSFTMRLDLLLLYDDSKHHYVLITDLEKLYCTLNALVHRPDYLLCRNCFWLCREGLTSYNEHVTSCGEYSPAVVKMPSPENNLYKFYNWSGTWFAPFVIYFDFESFLRPIPLTETPTSSSSSSTNTIEVHEPCGFCLTVIEHGNSIPLHVETDSSEDCMKNFVKMLHQLAKEAHGAKRQHPFYRGDRKNLKKDEANKCWICDRDFDGENAAKDLDHCHYTGNFLGWAHPECNRKRCNSRFVPVVGHNIQNYDLHHLCLALQECEPTTTISVIPSTDEKYMSLELGVYIKTITTKDGNLMRIYEYLRFVDSYKLFNGSLEKLVESLPSNAFEILEKMFPSLTTRQLNLLQQKGFYPYSYMTDRSKFAETQLPPLSAWKNSLAGGRVDIGAKELDHAQNVWDMLNCSTMQDYHDKYLKLDVALLACCGEYCRKISYETYRLDVIQFVSAPNMAKDAALKVTGAKIELLTNPQHLHMIERAIRGGLASVYHKRSFQANNKYLDNFDPDQPSTFGLLVDANNLYGGVMQTEPLPCRNYSFNEEISLEEVLATPQDSKIGYFLEVDLLYPQSIHNAHSDFPCAPEKQTVPDSWLSEYQLEIKNRFNISSCKVNKLLQTLYNKWNYVVHYKVLQLYVKLGLKITKVHRILQFEQEKWLEPYIRLNSQRRKVATNKFQENYYKLMNNSVYGKTIESKRNWMNVKIVRDAESTIREASTFQFDRFKIFGENMAALCSRPKVIKWNTPTIVGATVLELAKLHMYQFHYEVIRANFSARLLYSDTDSLLYSIETEDLYTDLKLKTNVATAFDFSNYPTDHELHNSNHKKEILKFKDEFGGDIMKSFICVGPKMYSITSKGKHSWI